MLRYRTVLHHAWSNRTELAGPSRLADELAFLPAALSLQETPLHPAPRRLAWGIMLLFALALLWSCVGQIDIVAIAPGRIIVSERTKVIQPLEASIVKQVLVKDGDKVTAGQVLVELDPTAAEADLASVQAQVQTQTSEILRARSLLRALSTAQVPQAVARDSLVDANLRLERRLLPAAWGQLQSEWADIRAKLSKLDAEHLRRQAEMATVSASITKLETTLPMTQARETDFRRLVEQGYVSGHAVQDRARERVELERDLAVQRARLTEAQSAAQETVQAKTAYREETLRVLNDRIAIATSRYDQLHAEAEKAMQRQRQTQLVSPVDGIVQQLAIHSTGGVVTSAQPLMVVVPESTWMTAEVAIANQDIGFVQEGQAASIKIETFPYTKYGTVDALVEVVAADAVSDEKKGSYYSATLNLKKKELSVDGRQVKLTPGMNVTAEIKTGQRRVIEYLLSPIQRAGSEGLRER